MILTQAIFKRVKYMFYFDTYVGYHSLNDFNRIQGRDFKYIRSIDV